jgi:hypothetical protein
MVQRTQGQDPFPEPHASLSEIDLASPLVARIKSSLGSQQCKVRVHATTSRAFGTLCRLVCHAEPDRDTSGSSHAHHQTAPMLELVFGSAAAIAAGAPQPSHTNTSTFDRVHSSDPYERARRTRLGLILPTLYDSRAEWFRKEIDFELNF